MKYLAILAAFVGLPASAQTVEAVDDLCASFGSVAEQTMRNRQNGVSMSLAMTVPANMDDPQAAAIVREIIIGAYGVPAYQSDDFKDQAVAKVRDDAILNCYKAMR